MTLAFHPVKACSTCLSLLKVTGGTGKYEKRATPMLLGKVSLWAHLRLLFLFAFVFAMVSASLSLYFRATSSIPDMAVLSPKLEIYRMDAARYDTVFIGTSRTLHHIVPESIADAAEKAGCEAPSIFNFGVPDLTGAEQDWLIGEVIKSGQGHLTRLVLEPPGPEASTPANINSTRARFFHGPDFYQAHLDSIRSLPESLSKRLLRGSVLAYAIGRDLSGLGQAAERAFSVETTPVPNTIQKFRREHGFEAFDEATSESIGAHHQSFINQPEKFSEALERYRQPDRPNLNARAEYMIAKLRTLQSQGLSVVLYISPDPLTLDSTAQLGKTVAGLAPDIPVFNYNRPDTYPALFERNNWHELSHASRTGANRVSAQIGSDLCNNELLEAFIYAVR